MKYVLTMARTAGIPGIASPTLPGPSDWNQQVASMVVSRLSTTTLKGGNVMKIRTNVKTRGVSLNHNEALAVRTNVKTRGTSLNHNEALAQ